MKLKNTPQLTLADIIRRRKTTLKDFLQVSGIQSYEALLNLCRTLGVAPPDRISYNHVSSGTVTSQQDGIVVVEPMPIIEEATGKSLDVSETVLEETTTVQTLELLEFSSKKRNKKKKN